MPNFQNCKLIAYLLVCLSLLNCISCSSPGKDQSSSSLLAELPENTAGFMFMDISNPDYQKYLNDPGYHAYMQATRKQSVATPGMEGMAVYYDVLEPLGFMGNSNIANSPVKNGLIFWTSAMAQDGESLIPFAYVLEMKPESSAAKILAHMRTRLEQEKFTLTEENAGSGKGFSLTLFQAESESAVSPSGADTASLIFQNLFRNQKIYMLASEQRLVISTSRTLASNAFSAASSSYWEQLKKTDAIQKDFSAIGKNDFTSMTFGYVDVLRTSGLLPQSISSQVQGFLQKVPLKSLAFTGSHSDYMRLSTAIRLELPPATETFLDPLTAQGNHSATALVPHDGALYVSMAGQFLDKLKTTLTPFLVFAPKEVQSLVSRASVGGGIALSVSANQASLIPEVCVVATAPSPGAYESMASLKATHGSHSTVPPQEITVAERKVSVYPLAGGMGVYVTTEGDPLVACSSKSSLEAIVNQSASKGSEQLFSKGVFSLLTNSSAPLAFACDYSQLIDFVSGLGFSGLAGASTGSLPGGDPLGAFKKLGRVALTLAYHKPHVVIEIGQSFS